MLVFAWKHSLAIRWCVIIWYISCCCPPCLCVCFLPRHAMPRALSNLVVADVNVPLSCLISFSFWYLPQVSYNMFCSSSLHSLIPLVSHLPCHPYLAYLGYPFNLSSPSSLLSPLSFFLSPFADDVLRTSVRVCTGVCDACARVRAQQGFSN